MFGNILTRLRNRTSNTTLLNLSEVKLHVRNELTGSGEIKSHLKRHFAPSIAPEPGQPSIPEATGGPPLEEIINSVIQHSPPLPISDVSHATPPSLDEFTTIISSHTQQVDEDNEDNETVSVSDKWSIPTPDPLDSTSQHWSSNYAHFANMTFDEELELYDLVEMDAEGDEDPDFDGTTQDILLN